MQIKWIAFLALLILNLQSTGQSTGQKPMRLGVGLVGAAYKGDLTTNGDALHRFYPGYNFTLQFASEKLISPQLNAGFGRFVTQDRDISAVDGIQPNTFVDTRFFHVDFRLKARFLRGIAFHPYLSAGIGFFGYTPYDIAGNNLLDNLSTRNEGETYGSIAASFPLSMGFEVEMSSLVMIGMEYTFRSTTSDYLDNISQLGSQDGNDMLNILTLSIFFTFDPNRTGESISERRF